MFSNKTYSNWGKHRNQNERRTRRLQATCRRRHFQATRKTSYSNSIYIWKSLTSVGLKSEPDIFLRKVSSKFFPCLSVLSQQILQLNFRGQEKCTIPQGQPKIIRLIIIHNNTLPAYCVLHQSHVEPVSFLKERKKWKKCRVKFDLPSATWFMKSSRTCDVKYAHNSARKKYFGKFQLTRLSSPFTMCIVMN